MGDTESFRDRVSTVDEAGKRIWVFPKKPKGYYTNLRNYLSYIQLLVLFTAPFIRIGGKPLILLDLLERRFVLMGFTFWPQDFFILGVFIIFLCVLIILFTTIYGRVWCGWLCPQTIFMEMLFRKIEYFIDGSVASQKKLAALPWNAFKIRKRIFKHTVYMVLSFIMGNVFLAYFIGSEALVTIITDPPENHITGLSIMLGFSLSFYWLYASFREQFCCFLCPYARLQSVLLDENSIGVAYDDVRGEPRGKKNKVEGDCVDCGLCAAVCPTGIDIRNGTPQLECVQCTACIDACDHVMEKCGRDKGLIRYASPNMIKDGTKFKITFRIITYTAIVLTLFGVMVYLLVSRMDVETTIIRSRGSSAIVLNNEVMNIYNAKVLNKSSLARKFNLRLIGEGRIDLPGGEKDLIPEARDNLSFFVKLPKSVVKQGKNNLKIEVLVEGKVIEVIETTFLGP